MASMSDEEFLKRYCGGALTRYSIKLGWALTVTVGKVVKIPGYYYSFVECP
jgi:hypothetical protein